MHDAEGGGVRADADASVRIQPAVKRRNCSTGVACDGISLADTSSEALRVKRASGTPESFVLDQGRAIFSISAVGTLSPRMRRKPCSRTSSRPAEIPSIVGLASTSARMPTR